MCYMYISTIECHRPGCPQIGGTRLRRLTADSGNGEFILGEQMHIMHLTSDLTRSTIGLTMIY
eukprot:COSAG02_NODE_2097_length_9832_cov_7.714579_7_plen_63_part_00